MLSSQMDTAHPLLPLLTCNAVLLLINFTEPPQPYLSLLDTKLMTPVRMSQRQTRKAIIAQIVIKARLAAVDTPANLSFAPIAKDYELLNRFVGYCVGDCSVE
jgi:hypothetical protein